MNSQFQDDASTWHSSTLLRYVAYAFQEQRNKFGGIGKQPRFFPHVINSSNCALGVGMGTLEFRICRIRIQALPNPAVLSDFLVRKYFLRYCVVETQ